MNAAIRHLVLVLLSGAIGVVGAYAGDVVYVGPPGMTGWGGCWQPSNYATESVPYFALHPPVYYSYRIARTYGFSPFAYPPGVIVTESGSVPPAAPNVYLQEGGEASQGRPPLRIDNPFVEQTREPGVAALRKPVVTRPQVVYPAALARKGPEISANLGKSL